MPATLLEKFDYLSTVSGGGYIGSWLTAWMEREKGCIHEVIRQLQPTPQAEFPEAKELHYLREYTSYLSPHFGLLSADTWALAAMYVRNVIMNLLVLGPVFFIALLIPRFALVSTLLSTHISLAAGMTVIICGMLSQAISKIANDGLRVDARRNAKVVCEAKVLMAWGLPQVVAVIFFSFGWASVLHEVSLPKAAFSNMELAIGFCGGAACQCQSLFTSRDLSQSSHSCVYGRLAGRPGQRTGFYAVHRLLR
jgi:hypothetical protein